jgi:hypothetical protein
MTVIPRRPVACLLAFTPAWLRLSAAVVAVLSVVPAGLGAGHVTTLGTVAPPAFVAFVLATALWMPRGAQPDQSSGPAKS